MSLALSPQRDGQESSWTQGTIPVFSPAFALTNGHLQTLTGWFAPGRPVLEPARPHHVPLADGDQIVLHDNCPMSWRPGQRVIMLLHGLAGCHQSPYLERMTAKLLARGYRAVRMDMRGCGAGLTLARWHYHGGRSDDVAAALRYLADFCPLSPVTLVGYSLGGNVGLKLAGECGPNLPGLLDSVAAVCPPADLYACVRSLKHWANRLYDRYFTRLLWEHVQRRQRLVPGLAMVALDKCPNGVHHFDECFTAPLGGFANAEDYYYKSSASRVMDRIAIPTLILAAANDPMVPAAALAAMKVSQAVRVHLVEGGGHLGFVARRGRDADRYWIDWRLLDWLHALPGGVP